ncbi:hypothetical protein EON65_05215 [archaeon]|nr:MAG: hypothetical protein EON65_05215 [archaeon]
MSEADQPVPMEALEPTQSSTPISSPTLKAIGSPMSTRSNNEGRIAKKLFTPEAEKESSSSKAR